VLTDFQVFNKPVAIGERDSPLQKHITTADRIQLRYDQSVISFSFAALNYRSPEKNQYAYRMEPFDKGWQYVGTKRTATYTNLDPGHYIFRVKGANNSGVWNEEGVAINIVITPPFWATWWFRGVLALFIVGGLMGAYRRRVQTFEKRQQELESQVADRTKALNEANEALNATNETVEKTNQQLEAKNEELERFAYTVSHDLKSPLVTIRGFLGLLKKDIATDDQQRMQRDFDQIINATDKMQRLLDELLRLSRVGRSAHVSETVSLAELADEAVALVSGHIAEGGVEVKVLPDLPVVLGDRVRLTEVFQNLIANAVKYMGDQTEPRIEIGARSTDAEVVCFVRDNGMGIDPRYHEKVFGLFERLDASNEGTGIGLALVKRIIEVHGGRVWVESEGRGQGSTFLFTLPRQA